MSLFRLIPDKHDVLQDHNKPDGKGTVREWLYITIFQSSTRAGRIFDVGLFFIIIANICLLMLESVPALQVKYWYIFELWDHIFMVLFTIEYLLRLYCVKNAKKYAFSFYGIVDLLAVLPSYMEFFLPQWHVLMIVRSFRLLRIFRIFRMVRFLDESRYMIFALVKSFNKIMVFLFFVVLLTIFLGSLMYVIEYNHNSGFSSIPQSIYWAIVTITTVGYGDIAPVTAVGKIIASFIMILGYSIIAVPTGIMSASMVSQYRNIDKHNDEKNKCPQCHATGHSKDALYCKKCGGRLQPPVPVSQK